mmetsp:Transcript_22409/g.64343  ORF Transcript_22409/g.64343 Transcript_22409/m.64343 type:complete len:280 (-) Transcript_22409:100-939(-)
MGFGATFPSSPSSSSPLSKRSTQGKGIRAPLVSPASLRISSSAAWNSFHRSSCDLTSSSSTSSWPVSFAIRVEIERYMAHSFMSSGWTFFPAASLAFSSRADLISLIPSSRLSVSHSGKSSSHSSGSSDRLLYRSCMILRAFSSTSSPSAPALPMSAFSTCSRRPRSYSRKDCTSASSALTASASPLASLRISMTSGSSLAGLPLVASSTRCRCCFSYARISSCARFSLASARLYSLTSSMTRSRNSSAFTGTELGSSCRCSASRCLTSDLNWNTAESI